MTRGRYARRKRRTHNSHNSESSSAIARNHSERPSAAHHRSLLTLLPAIIFLGLSLDYLWVTEDAFITFRSVENLWSGFGPNFNRGLRVESFSHPLWFGILAILRVCGTEYLPLLAAIGGVCLSVGGLIFATAACRGALNKTQPLFPLGALAIASLPPFWQFASSGLETGLAFFWIGFSLWALLRAREPGNVYHTHIFWILGLAPLIRPDLLIFSIPLLIKALLASNPRKLSRSASIVHYIAAILAFGAPASAWQIFRMGYYGAILPNTYIAKDGLHARWDQGLMYLTDAYGTYYLWPLIGACLLAAIVPFFFKKQPLYKNGSHLSDIQLIRLAILCGAVAHTLIVCRAGGDFMHARLLLPDMFAIFASFAVVGLPSTVYLRRGMLIVFGVWALYVILCARPSYGSKIGSNGIADERMWYVQRARTVRPISLRDYQYHHFYRVGESVAQMLQSRGNRAVYWAHIGIACAVIQPDLIIIDPLGLNDHINSRMELEKRGRPGHEKITPAAWFLARFPPGVGLVVNQQLSGAFDRKETPENIEAARKALQTVALKELEEAVTTPMNGELFVKNILRAWRLTFLTIPQDPQEALRRFGGDVAIFDPL